MIAMFIFIKLRPTESYSEFYVIHFTIKIKKINRTEWKEQRYKHRHTDTRGANIPLRFTQPLQRLNHLLVHPQLPAVLAILFHQSSRRGYLPVGLIGNGNETRNSYNKSPTHVNTMHAYACPRHWSKFESHYLDPKVGPNLWVWNIFSNYVRISQSSSFIFTTKLHCNRTLV
jgi:hypothetical protein